MHKPCNHNHGIACAARWDTNADQSVWTFQLSISVRAGMMEATGVGIGRIAWIVATSHPAPNAFYLDGLLVGAHCSATDLKNVAHGAERGAADWPVLMSPDVGVAAHSGTYLTTILSLSAFVPLRPEQSADDENARHWTRINRGHRQMGRFTAAATLRVITTISFYRGPQYGWLPIRRMVGTRRW
jgi:hypothetical protein